MVLHQRAQLGHPQERQRLRNTADLALRDRRLAFHKGEGLPVVTRYVVQR